MNPLPRFARVPILAAAALSALVVGSAHASAISGQQVADGPRHTFTYSTYLTRTEATTSWAPSVSFQGVQDQTVETPAPFAFNSFPVPLPEGSTSDLPIGKLSIGAAGNGTPGVYNGVFYDITVRIDAVDGVALADPITAVIQGQVSGNLIDPDGREFYYNLGAGLFLGAPYDPPLAIDFFPSIGGVRNFLLAGKDESTAGFLDLSTPQEIEMTARIASGLGINTPEPSTWTLFALAGVGTWRASRRGRRRGDSGSLKKP